MPRPNLEKIMAKRQPSKRGEEAAKKPAPESVGEPIEEQPEHVAEMGAEQGEEVPRARFREAIKEGAAHARSAVAEFVPDLGGLVHKGVYSGVYFLSFSVVFGSLMVASLLPEHNVIEKGVRDGAEAAKKAFQGRHEGTHQAKHTGKSNEEGLTPA
jgi:hypothetical protein